MSSVEKFVSDTRLAFDSSVLRCSESSFFENLLIIKFIASTDSSLMYF